MRNIGWFLAFVGAALLTGILHAQNPVTVQKVGSTAVDTNSGTKSAGTQRVVLATDQPALTNALKVDGSAVTQPISGTITANLGTLNGLFLDATFTGRMPAGASPASGESNTNTALSRIGNFNFIYNGSTWDRWTGAVTQATGTNLHMVCDSGCSGSGGTSLADEAAFTQGTTAFTPVGGIFKTTYTSLTSGQAGVLNLTAKGAAKVALFDTADNAITASVDATTNTTTQTTGPQLFGNGSAATPSAVGADGRSIALWTDTVGRLHVLGTDGDVFVRQTTASNFNVRQDTSGATGAAPPARADYVGGLGSGATGGFVIGVPVCDTFKAVSMTSATTTLMVTGVSGRHVRICSVNLVTAIANNVVLISGTGATCGTGTAGIAGGTTAANGWNFAANGGITVGSGLGTVMQTAATGDSVCIITSAAGPLAGTLAYTIY